MHHKIESSVSLLVNEIRLFSTGSDCHACCGRFISLGNSDDTINFPMLIFIPGKVFLECFPAPYFIPSPLSFSFLFPLLLTYFSILLDRESSGVIRTAVVH
jgi:hypothetical protein